MVRRFTLTHLLSVVSIVALVLTYDVAITRAAIEKGPLGLWLTEAGEAKVHVSQCGAAICAMVVWLREPLDSTTGQPQTDDKNPDPSLKQRPVIGLQLFVDMMPSAANSWSGRIYNADNGRSYAGTVTRLDGARLAVRGCDGAMCGKETWTRIRR
jgi:uncharacterized protein (DUF2147 family)